MCILYIHPLALFCVALVERKRGKHETNCVFVSLSFSLVHVAFTKHLCLIHCLESSDFAHFPTLTFLSSCAEAYITAPILRVTMSAKLHVYVNVGQNCSLTQSRVESKP